MGFWAYSPMSWLPLGNTQTPTPLGLLYWNWPDQKVPLGKTHFPTCILPSSQSPTNLLPSLA